MVKAAGNTYYGTKNQVRGLWVGGDMVILCVGSFHNKMAIPPPTHNPRTFQFNPGIYHALKNKKKCKSKIL